MVVATNTLKPQLLVVKKGEYVFEEGESSMRLCKFLYTAIIICLIDYLAIKTFFLKWNLNETRIYH